MFTQKEKDFLINVLNKVQITGNRQTIAKTMEELDTVIGKIQALPVEDVKPAEEEKPNRPRMKKKL